MSTTTITLVNGITQVTEGASAPTNIQNGAQAVTQIEHGTISQPYAGPQIYVQASAPSSPITGDVWFDTSP